MLEQDQTPHLNRSLFMNITVNGRTIETDESGFLKNPDDWNEDE